MALCSLCSFLAWFLLPHREWWDALLIIVERQGFVESVMHWVRDALSELKGKKWAPDMTIMGASVEFDTLGLLCYDTM